MLTGEFKEKKIIRLAPYSPMLNPIEPVWSVIKLKVKSLLAEQIPTLLREENHVGFRVEFRAGELENIVQRGVVEISNGLCNRFLAKVQTFIPNVLNLEDVQY